MSGPFEAAGAAKGATRYSALQMGARQFTGLVTQRSPYRDGAVSYLSGKFYGGTRFDTIWDGTNREISQKLTDRRAPGSAVYNNNNFPACNSFFDWKYIVDVDEVIRVIYDGVDGNIYDATAGQKSTLLTKAAGAGPARMLGLSTGQLFIGDGVETKKVIQPSKTWKPNTVYNVGDLILDPNGNVQKAYSVPLVRQITSVELFNDGFIYVRLTFDPASVGLFSLDQTQNVTLAGLSAATWLNGTTINNVYPFGPYGSQEQGISLVAHADYPDTPDTGTATGRTQTGSAMSGGGTPAWQTGLRRFTTDGDLVWQCFPGQIEDIGLPAPDVPPTTSPTFTLERYWLPALQFVGTSSPIFAYSILDPSNNVQALLIDSPDTYQNGASPPDWNGNVGGITAPNAAGIGYLNFGTPTSWFANTDYGGTSAQVSNPCCIVDRNGNLQAMTAGTIAPGIFPASAALTSGATEPATWGTNAGDLTVDGPITWVCLGAGSFLTTGAIQYAWSTHSIDGTVSTASPINAAIVDGILGPNKRFGISLFSNLVGVGLGASYNWIDEVWLWRTAQGKPTLIRLARIPIIATNPIFGIWEYVDMLPDTALNAFVTAPVADTADPPPDNFLPMCYALQRQWGIVDNKVVWSAGPDAVTGNGLTQFPPINFITFLGKPYAIFPITVQDGGQVVFTSSGIWIILGAGTPTDPFYSRPYFQSVNVTGYNAVTLYNQQFFVIESNLKVSSVAVEFPFQPATGYVEIGFPIGDQFEKVTTGGFNASLFNAATAFMTWNNQSTKESALYVSDGAGHWFRMNALQAPEQGLVWSPIRTLANGASAVQSVETSPGVTQLLIAPRAGTTGPILARDNTGTVFSDNGTPYPAWDAKGVTLLCTTGQWADIVHISAKSKNTGGARPTVGVLLGEIEPSADRPYINLILDGKGNDPPRTRASLSAYSDRYRMKQQGEDTSGDCILVKFDYGTNALGDELLDWGIYGGVHDEDEEQAEKA